jgi:hypothetical protein
MTRLRLPVIALTLLISSNAWADLKTYDVDPQYRQEIYAALQRILTPQGQPTQGRVELLPSGQILVNASPETLEQVEQVLQAIRNRPAAAAPRVALRYWGVLGTRAQGSAADTVGSPPPAVLNDVLGELRRLHGELTFRVIGTAAVATNSGQHGEVQGTTLSVEQTAHVQGDTLNAEISMVLSGHALSDAPPPIGNVRFGSLSLRTTLGRGEFVVLGESHVQAGGIDGPVFYIVRWEQ